MSTALIRTHCTHAHIAQGGSASHTPGSKGTRRLHSEPPPAISSCQACRGHNDQCSGQDRVHDRHDGQAAEEEEDKEEEEEGAESG